MSNPNPLPTNTGRHGENHVARAAYDAKTATLQDAFLTARTKVSNNAKAADAVGISRETVRLWERNDPAFAEKLAHAKEEFGDYLQDLALQKVERLESKDNLLHLAMLNAHVPHLYRPENTRTINDNRQVHIHEHYPDGPRRRSLEPESVEAEVREIPTDSVTETGDSDSRSEGLT